MGGQTIEVWPDNLEAVNLFIQVMGQWRMGFNGPVALDYVSVDVVMRIEQIPIANQSRLLSELRIMEDSALSQIARNKRNK